MTLNLLPPPPEPPPDYHDDGDAPMDYVPPEALEESQKPVLEFTSIADLAAKVDATPHPGWLARPVWPADSYGVIGAEQKLGKTWAVLDLIVSVASDGVWLESFPVERPGPVVVFLGEGGERKMLRRLRAIAAAKNCAVEELPIEICLRVPHLSDAEHLGSIAAKLAETKPVLTVIDPLYLAARGAKGSDLYAMGEALEGVQHLCQASGSALVVVHHWNKTGDGVGVSRFSGAGPAEWGRVIVSMSAVHKHTDPATKETAVTISAEFAGDEIPDMTYRFKRRVWASDPDDLESPMNYACEQLAGFEGMDSVDGLRPSQRRVLDALRASERAMSARSIGDAVAGDDTGLSPLKGRTIRSALSELSQKGLIRSGEADGYGSPTYEVAEIGYVDNGFEEENAF